MNMLPMPGEPAFDPERPTGSPTPISAGSPGLENEGMGYLSERYASKTFTSFSHTMADIVGRGQRGGDARRKAAGVRLRRRLTDAYDGRGLPLSFLLTAEKDRAK